jgi:uncharacterized membrane protein YbhN (UPF0104 family)
MQNNAEATTNRIDARSEHGCKTRKVFLFAFKLAITASCFWYLSTKLDWVEIGKLTTTLDPSWVLLATLLLLPQIAIVGLRWRWIISGLDPSERSVPLGPPIAITAISIFFQQVLPNLAAEGMRIVLVVRHGWSWQIGLASVLIDRCVGVLTMLIVSFAALLLPTAVTAVGAHRASALVVIGIILASFFVVLLAVPYFAPLLQRWRPIQPFANLATAVHRILLLSGKGKAILAAAFLVHAFTIASVWSLGQAASLHLSAADAAVLFAVVVGVALIPISVGGWGLRELAVATLLQNYGIALEQALLFSVSFGLITILAALPGAVFWALYPAESVSRVYSR